MLLLFAKKECFRHEKIAFTESNENQLKEITFRAIHSKICRQFCICGLRYRIHIKIPELFYHKNRGNANLSPTFTLFFIGNILSLFLIVLSQCSCKNNITIICCKEIVIIGLSRFKCCLNGYSTCTSNRSRW